MGGVREGRRFPTRSGSSSSRGLAVAFALAVFIKEIRTDRQHQRALQQAPVLQPGSVPEQQPPSIPGSPIAGPDNRLKFGQLSAGPFAFSPALLHGPAGLNGEVVLYSELSTAPAAPQGGPASPPPSSNQGSHEENLWSFIKFVANDVAAEGLSLVEEFAALTGPVLGAIGPLIAIILIFRNADDATVVYLQQEFTTIQAQLQEIQTQINDLTGVLQSSSALQTYNEQRYNLEQIQAAFDTFQINPLDPQVGNSFNYQCELYPPEGFLTFLTQQLTADGSCGFPTQCTLDPNAGVAQAVDWSRPAALQYFKAFILDAAQTVQLTSACNAMTQENVTALNNTGTGLGNTFVSIVQALTEYYNNVLPVAFWANSFENDLETGFNTAGNNQAIADATQALLSSKYDFLAWGVAVWNTGSNGEDADTVQGFVTGYCDQTSPPTESCTASGGAVETVNFAIQAGGTLSFMVFFNPIAENATLANGNAAMQAAVTACARGSGNDTTIMTSIAICLNYQFGPANETNTRGILVTPSAGTGSGLALSLGGSQVYQQTIDSQFYGSPDGGVNGVMGEIAGPEVTCVILLDYPRQ